MEDEFDHKKYALYFNYGMTKNRIKEFYHGWTLKAENENNEFDKFISNHIAYNALYNSFHEIKSYENETSVQNYDSHKAVKIWLEDKDDFEIDKLFNPADKTKISFYENQIKTILEKGVYVYDYNNFRINEILEFKYEQELISNEYYSNKKKTVKDAQYLEKINNNSLGIKIRIENLLEIMYKIRCNLIHGHKKISGDQSNNVSIGNGILEIHLPIAYKIWLSTIESYENRYRMN